MEAVKRLCRDRDREGKKGQRPPPPPTGWPGSHMGPAVSCGTQAHRTPTSDRVPLGPRDSDSQQRRFTVVPQPRQNKAPRPPSKSQAHLCSPAPLSATMRTDYSFTNDSLISLPSGWVRLIEIPQWQNFTHFLAASDLP